ncbi:MAG: HAD-IA family hydrolase, partial [Actinobacteria bacterium]|nr:HAD-IA family hydrolase [Actinomycetota bacterium]
TGRAIQYAIAQHGVEGLDLDQALAAQTRLAPYPEVAESLERMGRGRRLAVVSNGHPESLRALLANAGLDRWVSEAISAHEVRVFKPAPAVYQLALDRLGVTPDRLLFVSSNGWDAAGAARFGLRVAWVNRQGLPPEAVGRRPELTVSDLRELAARLEPS